MRRRRAVVAVVAAGAAAAGAGVAWWQRAVPRDDAAAMWALQFERPEGGALAMRSLAGRPLLLNFWATWCAPCVAELPLLDRFFREHGGAAGWQVLGLAIDSRLPVIDFLTRRPVGFPIALGGSGGLDLGRRLGNRGGTLPFTAVFDSRGRLVRHKPGVVEPADLERWRGELA